MRIRVNFPDLGPGYPRGSIFLSQASVSAPLSITTSLKQLEGEVRRGSWSVVPRAALADGGLTRLVFHEPPRSCWQSARTYVRAPGESLSDEAPVSGEARPVSGGAPVSGEAREPC